MQQKSLLDGKKAPEFVLTSAVQPVRLSAYRGRQAVLVCFVPDFAQAQSWRLLMALEQLLDASLFVSVPVLVLGNGRSLTPATRLTHTLRLPFTLLADDEHKVAARYGVTAESCACFLIDQAGQVVYEQQFATAAALHVADLRAALGRLSAVRRSVWSRMRALPHPALAMS